MLLGWQRLSKFLAMQSGCLENTCRYVHRYLPSQAALASRRCIASVRAIGQKHKQHGRCRQHRRGHLLVTSVRCPILAFICKLPRPSRPPTTLTLPTSVHIISTSPCRSFPSSRATPPTKHRQTCRHTSSRSASYTWWAPLRLCNGAAADTARHRPAVPRRACYNVLSRLQGMSLVPAVTELLLAELLYLQYDNPTRPIFMYINSAGVQVSMAEPILAEHSAKSLALSHK